MCTAMHSFHLCDSYTVIPHHLACQLLVLLLYLHVTLGGTRGVPCNDRSCECGAQEDVADERQVVTVWMCLLLLYSWLLTMACHMP